MIKEFDFTPYFHSPEILAAKVLEVYFDNEKPSYPIDPFKMLVFFGVIYQFRDFKDIEGIYLVPQDSDDISIVGINLKRPIPRQRFTAAHELCHHIKDRTLNSICSFGNQSDPIEKFADKFASALLMPKYELKRIVSKYEADGYVKFDDIIFISDYFGVSFESCVFTIAYSLNKISGDTESRKLRSRMRKFQPNLKRQAMGLAIYDFNLIRNIIDSYTYFFENESPLVWYNFKRDFIYNENKMEGINIDQEDIADILTDLRIHKQDSEFCKSDYKDIIEVVGHASIYEYLIEVEQQDVSAYTMMDFHRMLYQFAPHPEEAGKTRIVNNLVLGSKFESSDWHDIPAQIVEVDLLIRELFSRKEDLSVSDYVNEVVKIHHKMTVIHPFPDGNGRISRAMLNCLFKLKKLPPVYIKLNDKEAYYDALKKSDLEGNYSGLQEVFYKELFRSIIQLNSKFVI
ncbi:ImmA/IrrE family metallo-endopeptidase [Desulfosporosinus fructosivorans]